MSGYTPIFDSVFTGTLCGKWPDTGVWLCLLAMADKNGNVDVTPQYLSAVIGIPLDELLACMERFKQPDQASRTMDNDGRRLMPIDEDRPWGWKIINHGKYREKARLMARSSEDVASGKEAHRMRKRRFAAVGLTYEDGEHCRYCGDEATGVDHIDCDGPDQPANAVPSCHRCNTSKHRRDLLTFLNSCKWINHDSVMAEPKLARIVNWNGVSFDRLRPPSTALHRPSDTDTDTDTDIRKTTTGAARPDGPPEFEEFKAIFPKRAGSQPWSNALKAIRARLREGHTWAEILDGARRYAVFIQAIGKERTEHVLQAATFCGPSKRFLEQFDPPPEPEDADPYFARMARSANAHH